MKIPYSPNDPSSIRLLFTRIARNYDLTNTVISLGLDAVWRKKFARLFRSHTRLVDVCCGSGAMFGLLQDRISCGLDFTHAMLQVAAAKFPTARLAEGDAQKIPFASSTFDAATIVFSIRNIPDVPAALKELFRILRPGGVLGILDFGIPENRFLERLYLLYFKRIMPYVGSWVARDRSSYHYFVNSVVNFPKREAFLDWMRAAGFEKCRFDEYTAGAALVYLGEKP